MTLARWPHPKMGIKRQKSKQDKDIRDEEGGREKLESLNCLKICLAGVPARTCLPAQCEAFSQQYYIELPRVSQHAAHVSWHSCLLRVFLLVVFAKRS